MGTTILEMAQRHVVEGQERVARQQAMIAQLERDGHENMLPQARGLLSEMIDSQCLAEKHVEELTSLSSRKPEPHHELREVHPEDEVRGGREAVERPEVETDD